MDDFYVFPPRPDDIMHYGIKRKSGRFPWGSGERPYQGMSLSERRAAKDLKVGKERLANRIKRANEVANTDYYSKKVGWENTEKAGEQHRKVKEIKDISNEILSDEKRTRDLGRYTRNARRWTVGLTTAASGSVATIGSAFVVGFLEAPAGAVTIPLTGAGVIAKIGYDYYQKTKY